MPDKKDTNQFLEQLKQREYLGHKYQVTMGRSNHWQVRWNGQLVTVTSCSPNGGCRALDNLKARIKRFERTVSDASQDQGDRTRGKFEGRRSHAARA